MARSSALRRGSSSKFMKPPTGYRFRPTDGELVEYYLENKLRNTLEYNRPFLDVQLYAYNPDDLIAMHGDFERDQESWYFFTTRDRRYQNGSRPQRFAGDGQWRAVAADTPIVENGVVVGYKRVLDFFIGRNTNDLKRTEWKMHEYLTKDQKDRPSTLPSSSQNPMQLDDCVLCKIYKNRRTLKRKEHPKDKNENAGRNKRAKNHVVEVEHGNTGGVLLQRQIEHQNTGRRQQIIQQQIEPNWNIVTAAGEQEYYEYGGQIVEHQVQQPDEHGYAGQIVDEHEYGGQIVEHQIQRPDEHGYADQIVDEHEYAGQIVEHQIQLPETNVYDQPQYYDDGAMDLWIDMSFLYDGQQEDGVCPLQPN